ncbi:putative TPR domain protein; O-GlcNAc transferase related protein [Bradyrhizobium sp. ORS 375]|uniref:tetratricopeptide repeat protein n=1 Tax=Bradyrhizobium sp. (strain ORS 375) TaxID=566679 RepID=UPI0002407B6D|nr:tetratricopeptide repeat protein [Bradyrhizobium sp. ORS 375]CCD96848.1 putative TPR domain protein; O-GlcNAc transferase related protein [Bradyrhizobium sp. ORS 375]
MKHKPRRSAGKSPVKSGSPARGDTAEALCEAALRLLRAGLLTQAEETCRRALTLDAASVDALQAMGRVCLALKRFDDAIEWFARAIRQDISVPDSFVGLAQALQLAGRRDEAIKAYDRALQLQPDAVDSWDALGELLQLTGRHAEAALACDRLLQLAPDRAVTWFRLGEVLEAQGRRDEAALAFEQVLKLQPDRVDAANKAGAVHFDAGRYDEAIARFDQSLRQQPDQAGVLCLKGISLRRLRRYDEAQPVGQRAHALAPHDPDIANSYGCILQNLGRHDEAVAVFDKAIAIRPQTADFHNHRGTSLAELHRFEEAFASFDRAIALRPDFADAHWNAALFRLLTGDFEGGWAAREWGRQCRAVGFVERSFDAPMWTGDAPLEGRTILLHSDEGLGDTIQFARYATMAAAQGARVLLEVDAVLQPLLSGLAGVAQCLARGADAVPSIDAHCPLSSLPLAFATRIDTIPAAQCYLPPPPAERCAIWQQRLGPRHRRRVGLVWSGNPAHLNDHNRSMPLAMLAPLLDLDVQFVSLQKGIRPADKAVLAERGDIVDLTAEIIDFVETAALIDNLDLVVTVDTSVAHLSGAMGKPTWVMLPYTPDYRWLLDRDDSPWYPSVRLFRQDRRRDYVPVVARVREALAQLAGSVA